MDCPESTVNMLSMNPKPDQTDPVPFTGEGSASKSTFDMLTMNLKFDQIDFVPFTGEGSASKSTFDILVTMFQDN